MHSFEQEIDLILDRVKETLLYKNKKYGSSFDKQVDRYGYPGIMIPLRNKIDRLDQLYSENQPDKQESVEDSHFDGIGYHVLALRRHLFPNVLDTPLEKKAPYADLDD
jgi:hypothetical protein